MREKIAEIIEEGNRKHWSYPRMSAELLSLFKEQVEKLQPLSDWEIIHKCGQPYYNTKEHREAIAQA